MRWLLNLVLITFIGVELIICLGPPPAPDFLTKMYNGLRPYIQVTNLDTPGRFFSADPISPTIALVTTIDQSGKRQTVKISSWVAESRVLSMERIFIVGDYLGNGFSDPGKLATDIARYACRKESGAKAVEIESAQQLSPTPQAASQGVKPWSPELIIRRRFLVRQECGGVI